jgi:2-polyprenyl-3-methyl-5-hydroxy-6-metoxy-1,4-benzoquinol methylase
LDSSNSGFSAWDNFWQKRNAIRRLSWSKRRMISLISGYVKPGMDILDAGCGTGFFSSYFIGHGCNVYSMDYSEKALYLTKTATNHKSRKYINGNIIDAGTLTSLNLKFDIIFTDGLLEHYSKKEQDSILRNMKTVKKEQGCIINFVPNKFSLWSIVRPFVMNIEEKPFTMREFIDLHKRNGLNIVAFGGINALPLKISPERLLARHFGMLFYCIAI